MHDPRISALLRLKRFEQPPPGYFDQLLSEVHRRQRSELLHRPLWKIAIERMQVFFSEHSMGNLGYAGAMAALLVVGVATIGLLTPNAIQKGQAGAGIASSNPLPELSTSLGNEGANRMMVVAPARNGSQAVGLEDSARQNDAPAISAPRYVIDARPVSYEPAFSF